MKKYSSILMFALVVSVLLNGCGEPVIRAIGVVDVLVRVKNSRSVDINVEIGPADFGSVKPQALTDFRQVSNSDNQILLNDVATASSPANFMDGVNLGAGQLFYTYTFEANNTEGFELDEFIGIGGT